MVRTRALIVALVVSVLTVTLLPGVAAAAGGDDPGSEVDGECGEDYYIPEDPDCDGNYEQPDQGDDSSDLDGECGDDYYVPEDPDCDGDYEQPEQGSDSSGDQGIIDTIIVILTSLF